MSTRMPTYFISHGGGPWPWVEDMRKVFANLEQSLVAMVADFPDRPKAVLMISGHWESDIPRVMSSPKPSMVYDYTGFPSHTYEIKYSSPGAPKIAERVQHLLKQQGIDAVLDQTQGYDHGTFAPMEVMYPQADMPLLQLSILSSYDPAAHIDMGKALAPLRDEGVAIIGSGLSFHNLRLFGPQAKIPSTAFDQWLSDTMQLGEEARLAAIIDWDKAPYARECHQQEDHLVPLFVALGAAHSDLATKIYHDKDLGGGVTASSFKFG